MPSGTRSSLILRERRAAQQQDSMRGRRQRQFSILTNPAVVVPESGEAYRTAAGPRRGRSASPPAEAEERTRPRTRTVWRQPWPAMRWPCPAGEAPARFVRRDQGAIAPRTPVPENTREHRDHSGACVTNCCYAATRAVATSLSRHLSRITNATTSKNPARAVKIYLNVSFLSTGPACKRRSKSAAGTGPRRSSQGAFHRRRDDLPSIAVPPHGALSSGLPGAGRRTEL